MVAGHFRHLPVIEEDEDPNGDGSGGGVVAVLDITKCLYDALEKLERAYGTSKRILEASAAAMDAQQQQEGGAGPAVSSSSSGSAVSRYAEMLKTRLSGPDLGSLLSAQSGAPPVVSLRDTVYEAAKRMKAGRETAALVFDIDGSEEGFGNLAGIFTSKDLVLRVLAAGLDPATTPVHR
jgi:CBS domain-containing protein